LQANLQDTLRTAGEAYIGFATAIRRDEERVEVSLRRVSRSDLLAPS
jgi:hypothetical protein